MTIAAIYNPAKVSDLEGLRAEVKARWPEPDAVWLETTVEDPGAGQARRALDAGADLVLVCGGDGTVAECAGVLADTGTAIALIPFGTGNLLVRNLRLPLDVGEALDVAAGSGRDQIDVLVAGKRYFAVMAGLGFDAAMMRETDEGAKKRLGWIAYVGAGAKAWRRTRPRRYTIRVDEAATVAVRALAVLVGNVGELQAGMAVLPDADPRDGLLDVIVLAPRTWRDVVGILLRLVRRDVHRSPRVRSFQGRTVTVRADHPVPVEFDGDYSAEVDQLSVRVLCRALTLCVR